MGEFGRVIVYVNQSGVEEVASGTLNEVVTLVEGRVVD